MHFNPEQLDEALKFVNEKYKIDGGHFEIARENYHNETRDFFKEVFVQDEPISSSMQMEWNDDAENFIMPSIKENLSLIAVDDKTGAIMGIRITAIADKDKKVDSSIFKDEKMKKLFTFVTYLNEKEDFYNRFGVTEAVEFWALAVGRKYRRQGLGTKLMAGAVDLLRYCKPDNAYIKSFASSKYSRRIFEKVGFETTCEVSYKDYIVDGEVVFSDTGVHETIVGFALKL